MDYSNESPKPARILQTTSITDSKSLLKKEAWEKLAAGEGVEPWVMGNQSSIDCGSLDCGSPIKHKDIRAPPHGIMVDISSVDSQFGTKYGGNHPCPGIDLIIDNDEVETGMVKFTKCSAEGEFYNLININESPNLIEDGNKDPKKTDLGVQLSKYDDMKPVKKGNGDVLNVLDENYSHNLLCTEVDELGIANGSCARNLQPNLDTHWELTGQTFNGTSISNGLELHIVQGVNAMSKDLLVVRSGLRDQIYLRKVTPVTTGGRKIEFSLSNDIIIARVFLMCFRLLDENLCRSVYSLTIKLGVQEPSVSVSLADNVYSLQVPTDGPYHEQNLQKLVGVVDLIIQSNHSLLISVWRIKPAYYKYTIGHNSVIKTTELTPLYIIYIAVLFHETGLLDGMLNLVFGLSPTVDVRLANHNESLELGRKAPLFISKDATIGQYSYVGSCSYVNECVCNEWGLTTRGVIMKIMDRLQSEQVKEKSVADEILWQYKKKDNGQFWRNDNKHQKRLFGYFGRLLLYGYYLRSPDTDGHDLT